MRSYRRAILSLSLSTAPLACADTGGSDSGSSDSSGTVAGSTSTPSSSTTATTAATTSAADSGDASSGGTTATSVGDTDSAEGSTGAVVCPDAPPFDDGDAALLEQCTRRIYIEGGDDSRVTFSTDEGASWQTVRIDDIDGDDFVNELRVAKGLVMAIGKFGLWVDRGAGFEVASDVSSAGFDSYGGQLGRLDDTLLLTDNAGTFSSQDGSTWLALDPFPDGSHPPGFGGHHHGVADGAGVYLVFQDQGLRRFDGTSWSEDALPAAPDVQGVAYGAGMFVVVGNDGGSGFTRTSVDGVDWSSAQTVDDEGAPIGNPGAGIVFDGAEFRIYTQYSGTLGYRSTDGVTWTPLESSHHIDRVAYDDGRYFAAGEGMLLGSDDGLTWTELYTLAVDETQFINGARVAIGRVLL